MPKLKPNKAAQKRFKVTKSGKIIRRHTRLNHFLEKKSQSRKRRLSQTAVLKGGQAKSIKRQLGV